MRFNNIIGSTIITILCITVAILGVRLHVVTMECNESAEKLSKCTEMFLSTSAEYDDLTEEYKDLMESYSTLETQYKKNLYSEEEVELLVKCVECEAGFNDTSQKYITSVILNRVASKKFPNSITEVIYQDSQFSVASNGMMDKCSPSESTYENVYDVLLYGSDLPSYVLYFYADSVTENWVNNLNIYTTCGGSIFAY